ncbi:MAG: M14 family metallopeptidase [Pirellulales bacterium]|nr:M14 family metallopeptidase [Pirellulales bacterium]
MNRQHNTQQVTSLRTQLGIGYRSFLVILLLIGMGSSTSQETLGQDAQKESPWLLPLPEVDADAQIPTMKDVLGYDWGDDVSSHAQLLQYVQALAAAAPERTHLYQYGESYEGKELYHLVVSSADNIERLEELRKQNLLLADPRQTTSQQAAEIAKTAPAIVLLQATVHGNEISPSDAALLTAYHLLADKRSQTKELLDNVIVVIDPVQNADGRDRFVNGYRKARGEFPSAERFSFEHDEPWPGGRTNHYYFDMNRDWFLQTQREAADRVAAYLNWQPHVTVDNHEMGADSTFYFPPPTDPINKYILPRQRDWLERFGQFQAGWFDRYGFGYTTREMFDSFYPGYGESWPTLQGSIGMLWEQASARGLVIERADDRKLHYADGVRHNYVSALATIETAARDHEELLRDFHEARRDSIRLGKTSNVSDFFLLNGSRPARTARLAQLLINNGIEVYPVTETVHVRGSFVNGEEIDDRAIPAGSYHVPVAQPAGRLVRSLLDREVQMDREFVERQLDRAKRHLGNEIYDVTAWSLPLAYDVPAVAASECDVALSEPLTEATTKGDLPRGKPHVAYLIPADDDNVLPAVAGWLRAGLRIHVVDQPFVVNGREYGKGTLILKTAENEGDELAAAVKQAVEEHGIKVHKADSGYVDRGVSFGGPEVHWLEPPRIAMAIDSPIGADVGHTWYLFDQIWRYPTTRMSVSQLAQVDLSRFNVVVLPAGSYGRGFNDSALVRLRDWIRRGGTLVTIGSATSWAASENVGLLNLTRREKVKKKDDSNKEGGSAGYPQRVPGAFLRAKTYDDHFVTFGVDRNLELLFNSSLICDPLDDGDGRNLVTFSADKERVVASGFCWPETIPTLPGAAYTVYSSRGGGHVIGFTDNPNFRAMCPATQRLFWNAVFFGPAH